MRGNYVSRIAQIITDKITHLCKSVLSMSISNLFIRYKKANLFPEILWLICFYISQISQIITDKIFDLLC